MQPAALHLDDAQRGQDRLRDRIAAADGGAIDARDLGPSLRLWGRPAALDALRARVRETLPSSEGPRVVFSGSGDFHHLTPILVERAAETSGRPLTIVHFDNHPDWVRFDNGLHCGSWVGRAARLPSVRRLITVGVCSRDTCHPERKGADLDLIHEGRVELYAYRHPQGGDAVSLGDRRWPTIETIGEAGFIAFLPSRAPTSDIYVTIDKDVLRAGDAVTNWDQGQTSLALLEAMLRALAQKHRIVGADIVGDWSPAVYGGSLVERLMKRGEALLDQPWGRREAVTAGGANERVNLALLDLFDTAAP